MAQDMCLDMALPYRISVYIEGGKTWIRIISPTQTLSTLSDDIKIQR